MYGCMDSEFTHPYDAQGFTMADTVLPSVDEFDWNDPAAKVWYDRKCQEKKELLEFYRKRAFLHGKIISKLSQEVHDT